MNKAIPILVGFIVWIAFEAIITIAAGTENALSLFVAFSGIIPSLLIGWSIRQYTGYRWRKHIHEEIDKRIQRDWPQFRARLEQQYQQELSEWQSRLKEAEQEWERNEKDRVEWAYKLIKGEIEAIHLALTSTLGDIDFPFETECDIALSDVSTAYVRLDLPEIEDVIPEVRLKVLKDGRIKEVKRKKAERCSDYANLVTGLALMISSAVFATAPTLESVAIAAYTQRKQRRSAEIGDDYIFNVKLLRSTLIALNPMELDPVGTLRSLNARMKQKSNYEFEKLKPPNWVTDLQQ